MHTLLKYTIMYAYIHIQNIEALYVTLHNEMALQHLATELEASDTNLSFGLSCCYHSRPPLRAVSV